MWQLNQPRLTWFNHKARETTGCYWDLLRITVYWDLLRFTEIYLNLLRFTLIYWDLLKITEIYCDLLFLGFLELLLLSTLKLRPFWLFFFLLLLLLLTDCSYKRSLAKLLALKNESCNKLLDTYCRHVRIEHGLYLFLPFSFVVFFLSFGSVALILCGL